MVCKKKNYRNTLFEGCIPEERLVRRIREPIRAKGHSI